MQTPADTSIKERIGKIGEIGIFIYHYNNKPINIMTYFVDALWGENKEFEHTVGKLKQSFRISSEHKNFLNFVNL